MKYLDLFSGIGGFALGIQQAYENTMSESVRGRSIPSIPNVGSKSVTDHERTTTKPICDVPICIGYSEIDKYAIQIYQQHFNHTNYGDITKIDPATLPDFDLLVGGFPCQAFSIAGKRLGFADTRGTLFFDIARILKEKHPRLFLLENVKGLLSHDNGNTFKTIISTLDELGYDLQWQVLNSKNHGVPQNRERVFIVGHSRNSTRPKVFPFGQDDSKYNDSNKEGCANTLTSRNAGGMTWRGNYIKQLNNPIHSNDRVYGDNGISPTLNTMQGGMRQPFIANTNLNGQTFTNEHAGTIRAGASANYQTVNAIRRLTPTECERLQGFPDGWTAGVSDTRRYFTLGNAVTVNVIRDIMTKLL